MEIRALFSRSSLWTIHGYLLGVAFLLLLPVGTVLIRRNSATSFRDHWMVQSISAAVAITGMILGFFVSHSIARLHQYVGLTLLFCMVAQPILGYLHHRAYLKTMLPSKFTFPHIWLGRGILLAGGLNVVAGLSLRGRPALLLFLVFGIYVAEVIGVTGLLWRLLRRKSMSHEDYESQQLRDFAVDDLTEEEDDDDDRSSSERLRDERA